MKLNNIAIALMKKLGEIDSSTYKANFTKLHTVQLNIQEILDKGIEGIDESNIEDAIETLLPQMYEDLIDESIQRVSKPDYIGLWISTEEGEFENSMSLDVLHDIRQYGSEDIEPIYELYMMTIPTLSEK